MKKFMVSAWICIVFFSAHLAYAGLKEKTDPRKGPYRSGTLFDYGIELGYGKRSGDGGVGMMRFRLGRTFVEEPSYTTLGFIFDIYNNRPVTFGLQLEHMDSWAGLWGQLGSNINLNLRPSFLFSGGWSLFGAEFQAQLDKDKSIKWTIMGKFKIPISYILEAIKFNLNSEIYSNEKL